MFNILSYTLRCLADDLAKINKEWIATKIVPISLIVFYLHRIDT